MGADMIGYFLTYPSDKKVVKKALAKHVSSIMKDLALVCDVELLRTGEFCEEHIKKERVEEFLKKHSSWDEEISNSELEPVAIVEMIMKDMDLVASFDPREMGYRDLALTSMKINGKEVDTVFAGGMSWGDEPDGAGYDLLKAMWRTGAGDILWQAVHWDARKR